MLLTLLSTATATLFLLNAPFTAHTLHSHYNHSQHRATSPHVDPSRNDDSDLIRNLGSATPYWIQQDPSTLTPPPHKSCRLLQLNLLSRHGERNPSKSDVVNYLKFQRAIQQDTVLHQSIAASRHSWLLQWQSPFEIDQHVLLVDAGMKSQFQLAQRLVKRHDVLQLANWTYINEYSVQSTTISRAYQSAASFMMGISTATQQHSFETQQQLTDSSPPLPVYPAFITTVPVAQDQLLRFFKLCPAYLLNVKNRRVGKKQIQLWYERIENQVLPAFKQQLNLPYDYPLEMTHVRLAYRICIHSAAVYRDVRFCRLFPDEHLSLMAYADDLQKYWDCSYGFDINWQMASSLLKYYINQMNQAKQAAEMQQTARVNEIESNDFIKSESESVTVLPSHKASFANIKHAHGETIVPLLSILGLFKDEFVLRADSDMKYIERRVFRSSVLVPFSSNLQMELYQCPSAADESQFQFFVKTLVNEREMILPKCEGKLYCPLDLLTEQYTEEMSINLDKLCQVSQEEIQTLNRRTVKEKNNHKKQKRKQSTGHEDDDE